MKLSFPSLKNERPLFWSDVQHSTARCRAALGRRRSCKQQGPLLNRYIGREWECIATSDVGTKLAN
jgi:hypothetical protein